MPQYFNLFEAHGILAAITLLFIVPFAVVFPRFYTRDTRSAVRSISGARYCQILTDLASTAVLRITASAGPVAIHPKVVDI
ncbi:hypothetical protein EPUS_01460 [Endocarpon pusillum Z07020]|uniref:Uncharacterized protein n=1 Tax=Endocarpon pusillum (strain Z07020 / HMAS-L-300199) TaxID=1263415 RepID=U1GET8_ENDPU|nr:uncharacterized protein EPUS_01460 [Endocarpon pusillum Z07020]ERF76127.1 hypothetical protein EPUS_01460 [Endocarpon pusillum Z07020]